jgi:hypothetical protein
MQVFQALDEFLHVDLTTPIGYAPSFNIVFEWFDEECRVVASLQIHFRDDILLAWNSQRPGPRFVSFTMPSCFYLSQSLTTLASGGMAVNALSLWHIFLCRDQSAIWQALHRRKEGIHQWIDIGKEK